MSDPTLTPFLNPRGVAMIGISRDPSKLGYFLARNLVESGYGGATNFVNPRGGTLFGQRIYADIKDVPDPVDLVVVLVPPTAVPDALQSIGQRGIKAAILATGGFKEIGAEGAALEKRCLEIAGDYNIRLVGPNCVGWINSHLPLNTTFLQPPGPPPGEIALLSQSGALCAIVTDWVRGQGFGLSHLISLGNQADVSEADMLEPVAADPHTRAITLYIEMVSDGQRFVEAAARVARQKPLVALKVGRFEAGQKAAASHTGALAGSETAYEAGFSRAGVLRAANTEELFGWAKALAWCPPPHGDRVAILTNAGGPGVAASDALELNGLKLAQLSQQTTAAMQAILPAAASVRNPVDMLASASAEQTANCLRLLLEDPGVDMIMVIIPPPPTSTAGTMAKTLIPIIQSYEKPVVFCFMGEKLIQEGVELARASKIPEYRFVEPAASALGALYRRTQLLQQMDEPVVRLPESAPRAAAELAGLPAGQFIPQDAAAALLEAYQIETLRPVLAASADEAVEVADRLGYPVVLKVASADIPHKSDVGGVLLNVADAAAVRAGYAAVTGNARRARPQASIEGVHMQRMLPPGQEVIVGIVRDPQFGALVMFGSGGVEVEGLKDVTFSLAPLSREEAARMLERTWAGRKLRGFRSLAPADREAVIDTLVKLAALGADLPQIAEIEINPLRVLGAGQGAVAVDVRAKLGEE